MRQISETCVMVPVELLQDLRSCIIGFEADKAANMLPTDASLSHSRDLIRSALDTPRDFIRARSSKIETSPMLQQAAE